MKTNLILLLFLFPFTTSLICQPLILNNPNTSLIFGTIDNVKDENSDVHQIITLKDVKSIYNFVDTNLLQINITANAITYCLSCFPNYFSDNMIGECVFLFIEKKNNEYYLIPNPNSNTIFNSNLLFQNSIKLLENHNYDSLFYSIKDYYKQFDTSNFFALSEYLKNKIIDTTEYEFIRLNSVFEFNFLVTNRANINDELYYFYYYNCLYWIFNNIELPYIIARTIFIQIHNYLYTQEFLNSTDKYNLIKMYNIDNQIFIREKIIKELKDLKTIKSNLFVENLNSDSLLFLIGKVISVRNNFIYLENIRGINKDFVKEKLKIKIILDTDKVENIQIDKLLNKEILVNVYCDDNIYYTYTKKNLFYPTLTPNFENIFLLSNENLKSNNINLDKNRFLDTIFNYYKIITSSNLENKSSELLKIINCSTIKFLRLRAIWDYANISKDLLWSFNEKNFLLTNLAMNIKNDEEVRITSELVFLISYTTLYNSGNYQNIYPVLYYFNSRFENQKDINSMISFFNEMLECKSEFAIMLTSLIIYDMIDYFENEIFILYKWKNIMK